VGDKNERREHHCEIPVIYTAIGAASVFHKPCLEGAEKEDAYHIANAVCESYQDEYARVNDICEIKDPDRAVEGKPSRRDCKCAPRSLQLGLFLVSGYIIAGKLLLTPGTFELGWEKPASHFNGIDYPDQYQKEWKSLVVFKKNTFTRYAFEYIKCRNAKKHQRADHHFDVMQCRNTRNFIIAHTVSAFIVMLYYYITNP
jgi:hypothetical protein